MANEDVLRLAREAGFPEWWLMPSEPERKNEESLAMLERFFKLAVAEEREECAKICDRHHDKARTSTGAFRAYACSEDIRARGTL